MSKPFKYISLFCGCGGFDLGMEGSPFTCIRAFDINKFAIDTYNANIESVAVEHDLHCNFDLPKNSIDLILSGSPCQGFSTAGKRDINDPRNNLFLRAVEIACALKPNVFVSENVYGILSGEHKSKYMDNAVDTLRNAGFKTQVVVINCLSLGMAQMRKRALLFAWRTGREISISPPSLQPQVLRDAIFDIPQTCANHDTKACSTTDKQGTIATYIKPGQKLSNVRGGPRSVHTWDIPEVFGAITPKERLLLEALIKARRQLRNRDWGDADPVTANDLATYVSYNPTRQIDSLIKKGYLQLKSNNRIDLKNTFNGKFRRLSWDAPSVTVDTRFGCPTLFLHPTESRAFTVREAARLQGFPDSFTLQGPTKIQYEMVGNAVPLPLGNFVSKLATTLCSNE